MYLASGKAMFYLDTVPFEIGEGEAVIINSGTIHSGVSRDFDYCVFYAFVFDFAMFLGGKTGDSLSKHLIPIHKGQYSLPIKMNMEAKQDREILQQVQHIIDVYVSHVPAYPLTILSFLYGILSELIMQGRLIAADARKTEVSQMIIIKSVTENNNW